MITIGIDIGTSGVKAALVRDGDRAGAQFATADGEPSAAGLQRAASGALVAGRLRRAFDELRSQAPQALADTTAIGLSGQMRRHAARRARRGAAPLILWNDGRSDLECRARAPLAGAAPGHRQHRHARLHRAQAVLGAQTSRRSSRASPKVLLPKAYLRWRLSGEYAEDCSDASGTLWLDVGARRWSAEALAACHMSLEQMPRPVEGSGRQASSPSLTARWGFRRAPIIAGGAGDNAAGAVGVGAVRPGDAFVSLGTSGVLWNTTATFAPNPAHAVHAFCHAVPDTWHQMGVLLAAASSLAPVGRRATGPRPSCSPRSTPPASPSARRGSPHLSGERTPHLYARARRLPSARRPTPHARR